MKSDWVSWEFIHLHLEKLHSLRLFNISRQPDPFLTVFISNFFQVGKKKRKQARKKPYTVCVMLDSFEDDIHTMIIITLRQED